MNVRVDANIHGTLGYHVQIVLYLLFCWLDHLRVGLFCDVGFDLDQLYDFLR